jgi:Phage Tail Collar Domain
MAYNITKSDGTQLTNLPDYEIDNTTLSINLIGKDASGYGQAQNENFVKLLEHFSSEVPPSNALSGQIWFDKSVNVLRPIVYDGGAWRPLSTLLVATTSSITDNYGNTISALEPGDFWYKSDDEQLYINTGTGFALIGPQNVPGFGTTQLHSTTMNSVTHGVHPVIQLLVDGEVIAVISNQTFQSDSAGLALGFNNVYRGITFKNFAPDVRQTNTSTDVLLYGLLDHLDSSYTRSNVDELITANWFIADNAMFQFGSAGNSKISFVSPGGGIPNNLTIDHPTGIITVAANGSNFTYDGTAILPNADISQDLGGNGRRWTNVYTQTLNAGVATTQAFLNGQWTLTANSQLNPHGDSGNNIGTSALRYNTLYSFNLSPGADLGTFKGNWQLDAGSQLSPHSDLGNDLGQSIKRFGTVYASALSANTDGDRLVITGDTNVTGSIKPTVDQQYNVGDPDFKWNTIYTYDLQSSTAEIGALDATILQLSDSFQNTILRFDRDSQLTANSDNRIPTQAAVKAYVDTAGVNSGVQIGQIQSQLQAEINALQALINGLQLVPTGAVFYLAASTAPTGYLVCDGSSLSTTAYPKLFGVIGYTYGGSGNNFNLPDLRGEFVRGIDLNRGVDPGRGFGSTQTDSFGSHSHGMPGDDQLSFANGVAGWSARSRGGFPYDARSVYGGGAQVWSTTDEGSSETRPTNVALLPIIYYR